MDAGLLLIRLVTGLLLVGHGVQKVSFRLGGNGLSGGVEEFRDDGFRGGRLTAVGAAAGQIGAGLFLAAGALTPLAAMAAMGVMTVAVTVKRPHGLWSQHDGYEYPVVLVVIAATVALTGPGRWSVDHALGVTPWTWWIVLAALLIGPAGGLLTRVVLHRPPGAAGGKPRARSAD